MSCVFIVGTEHACRWLRSKEFLWVLGGMSMNAVVDEEGDLAINSEWDREPVERFENGGDMTVFTQPHHYLCSFANTEQKIIIILS